METLVWGWNHMPRSIIFDKMLDLALPIVKSYRSDLYHDALWLNDLENRSTVFYYTVRESGTWISKDFYNTGVSDTIYKITIERDDNDNWSFSAERVF